LIDAARGALACISASPCICRILRKLVPPLQFGLSSDAIVLRR
jgi:hypothetical protein